MYRWESTRSLFGDRKKSFRTKVAQNIWEDVWEGFFGEFDGHGSGAVSINVSDKAATIEIEFAGYDEKDLSVTIENQVITVSGKRGDNDFTKTFRVDARIYDTDSMKAKYKNGLLTVTVYKLLKKEAQTAKRAVPIQ